MSQARESDGKTECCGYCVGIVIRAEIANKRKRQSSLRAHVFLIPLLLYEDVVDRIDQFRAWSFMRFGPHSAKVWKLKLFRWWFRKKEVAEWYVQHSSHMSGLPKRWKPAAVLPIVDAINADSSLFRQGSNCQPC